MGFIFLSYDRQDSEVVDDLVDLLEANDCPVWIDREDIRGGGQWRRQIVNAIDRADAFVIVLSPNSVQSDNVRKELDLAEDRKKVVVPVVIEPVAIPPEMDYQLVGLQRIDLVTDFDSGFGHLLDALGVEVVSEPSEFLEDYFQPEEDYRPGQRFICPQCGLPFKRESDLGEHIANWHRYYVPSSADAIEAIGDRFYCPVCNLPFKRRSDLDEHMSNWHGG